MTALAPTTIKKPEKEKEMVSQEEYERRIREIVKCKRDPVYFAENYYKIVNLDKGLITIDLYDVQKELLKKMQSENRLAVCASRQSGKCVFEAKITIKSKKTGEIETIPIEKFWSKISENS